MRGRDMSYRNSKTRYLVLTAALVMASAVPALAQEASDATKRAHQAVRDYLPFDDTTDFKNARRGFIATLDSPEIKGADGSLVYHLQQFDFTSAE